MTSVKLVIQSNLSDALIEMTIDSQMAKLRIEFVKFLINRYPKLNVKLSDEELDDLWNECHIF